MTPPEYLHMQMIQEGLNPGPASLMTGLGSAGASDMPLILLARTSGGRLMTYIDKHLPLYLFKQLSAVARKIDFAQAEPLGELLHASGIQTKLDGPYSTYIFPEHFAHAEAPAARSAA